MTTQFQGRQIFKRGAEAEASARLAKWLDGEGKRAFLRRDLQALIERDRAELRLLANVSSSTFIEYLKQNSPLREVELQAEQHDTKFMRFLWKAASPLEVALSFRRKSYLTHYTAAFLHGLTEQIPKVVYVNQEQSLKPAPDGGLSQAALTKAFQNKQRESSYIFPFEDSRIVVLSGKRTERLQVGEMQDPESGSEISVTKLERTLIDLAVRPVYGGGVYEVQKAFQHARDRISVGTLIATLKELRYVYPYHQALGFYMERAGYATSSLDRVRKLGLDFEFYLAHGLKQTRFDTTWRIHVPQGM